MLLGYRSDDGLIGGIDSVESLTTDTVDPFVVDQKLRKKIVNISMKRNVQYVFKKKGIDKFDIFISQTLLWFEFR